MSSPTRSHFLDLHAVANPNQLMMSEAPSLSKGYGFISQVQAEEVLKIFKFLSVFPVQFALNCWAKCTTTNKNITSPFSKFTDAEIDEFLLGDGVCTGATLDFSSKYFVNEKDIFKSSPYELLNEPVKTTFTGLPTAAEIEFYPFVNDIKKSKDSSTSRFLQAAYKISFQMKNLSELVPTQIQSNMNLYVKSTTAHSHNIENLISVLREHISENTKETSYLLALKMEKNHALGMILEPPYILFDQRHGIIKSTHLESFLLYVANFLTLKYSQAQTFAMLEFNSKKKTCKS